MGAIDIRVHRGEAVGKTLRDKTLGCKVVTLIERVLADYVEDAGITFKTGRVQVNSVEQVSDSAESRLGCL